MGQGIKPERSGNTCISSPRTKKGCWKLIEGREYFGAPQFFSCAIPDDYVRGAPFYSSTCRKPGRELSIILVKMNDQICSARSAAEDINLVQLRPRWSSRPPGRFATFKTGDLGEAATFQPRNLSCRGFNGR